MADKQPAAEPRALHEIAAEIQADWGGRMYYGAVPYVQAMGTLTDVRQSYGAEPAAWIVRYFLSNASRWTGPTARRIKAELKEMLNKARA